MAKWLYLAAAIAFEVTGTLALRATLENAGWIALVVIGYLGAFGWLALVLRAGMPVGVAYGIWSAVGVALTAVLASILFGDLLTWTIGAGILLVIGGVLLIEFGSRQRPSAASEVSS